LVGPLPLVSNICDVKLHRAIAAVGDAPHHLALEVGGIGNLDDLSLVARRHMEREIAFYRHRFVSLVEAPRAN
jgi:hypothetical protein